MPPCKNDPKSSYQGTEPSPKGLGYCAHAEKVGTKKKGRNGKIWIVKLIAGKSKRWMPYKDGVDNENNIKNLRIGNNKKITCKNFIIYITKARKKIAGLKTRPGYFKPWVSYNQFANKERKVLRSYKKMKRITKWDKARYCGKLNIIDKKSVKNKIQHIGKKYFTHDNGGNPFLVCISSDVTVYKIKENTYIPDNYNDPIKYSYLYNEKICSYKPRRIFIGKSPKTEFTIDSYGPDYDGNTILLHINGDKYLYIGESIYEFRAFSEIVEYVSPVGHNDVPYPYAIDKLNNYYLLVENIVINISKEFTKKHKNLQPYIIYYNRSKIVYTNNIKEKIDYKKKTIKGLKVIHKRLW